ncbi:hypothetical protein JCM8547_001954 [Rhodosporidiobolus lusitaniae]
MHSAFYAQDGEVEPESGPAGSAVQRGAELGDLNFRKLTYDCHAPYEEPFSSALGPLATQSGTPPVLALRTIKSDVVVNIPNEKGVQLDKDEPGWKISGAYAVVLVSPGRKGEPVAF